MPFWCSFESQLVDKVFASVMRLVPRHKRLLPHTVVGLEERVDALKMKLHVDKVHSYVLVMLPASTD